MEKLFNIFLIFKPSFAAEKGRKKLLVVNLKMDVSNKLRDKLNFLKEKKIPYWAIRFKPDFFYEKKKITVWQNMKFAYEIKKKRIGGK